MNVNVWDVTEPIKALIRRAPPSSAARLADPDVPLEELAWTHEEAEVAAVVILDLMLSSDVMSKITRGRRN